jgi:hypothetical protein
LGASQEKRRILGTKERRDRRLDKERERGDRIGS